MPPPRPSQARSTSKVDFLDTTRTHRTQPPNREPVGALAGAQPFRCLRLLTGGLAREGTASPDPRQAQLRPRRDFRALDSDPVKLAEPFVPPFPADPPSLAVALAEDLRAARIRTGRVARRSRAGEAPESPMIQPGCGPPTPSCPICSLGGPRCRRRRSWPSRWCRCSRLFHRCLRLRRM
jgi:hypothetical protein